MSEHSGAVVAYVAALQGALERYQRDHSAVTLDRAFGAAAAAVAALRGARAGETPDVTEVRQLFAELPDFERLVVVAAGEAERSARAAGARIWQRLGLLSDPPAWSGEERARAQLLVACACAPLDGRGSSALGPRLLKLAAERWATMLADELRAGDEDTWRRALGDRYQSVWQRCAPRTKWRTRELSELLIAEPKTYDAVRARLAQWLGDGGDPERLAAELEAALVQSRAPARLA